MHSLVRPNAWVVLRLPSDTLKVEQIVPNTVISLGKFGSFQTNSILSRPYHLTYEIQDYKQGKPSGLRVVPTSELYADVFAEEDAAEKGSGDENIILGGDGVEFELVGEDGEVVMRSNRETIDDSARQTLSMEEIEALKRDGADAGKDIIAKLMLSHTGLTQKTSFSLAKYKILKTKKFLRQFAVLPLDVTMLLHWISEMENTTRVLEIREETLALLGCWANVHFSCPVPNLTNTPGSDFQPSGRWLVVDDAAGLLVAAMAERMGILTPEEQEEDDDEDEVPDEEIQNPESQTNSHTHTHHKSKHHEHHHSHYNENEPQYASSNTLTLIHTNAQPNLSLLKYFDYTSDLPSPSHPLTKHLKPISWLQLLSPEEDFTYSTPPPFETAETLASWKSTKRGHYYRKRRRWARAQEVVNETRAGGFDGLVVMSTMDPVGIMQTCVPLLRGGAHVVVYSPTAEPLVGLVDLYSKERRTAFIRSSSSVSSAPPPPSQPAATTVETEDFPLDPTALLGVDLQTSKARPWQVLPGRTHPLMMGKGGAEGFLFTATRALRAEGKISARGAFQHKRRKLDGNGDGSGTPGGTTNSGGGDTPEVSSS